MFQEIYYLRFKISYWLLFCRDLLGDDQNKILQIREDKDLGVYVKDLSSHVCSTYEEMDYVMYIGGQNRRTGATEMNEHSSRSHAILIITVEMKCGSNPDIKKGRLNMVDLAGSERQRKSGAVVG